MLIDPDRFDAVRLLVGALRREAAPAENRAIDSLLSTIATDLERAKRLIDDHGLFLQVPHGYVPPSPDVPLPAPPHPAPPAPAQRWPNAEPLQHFQVPSGYEPPPPVPPTGGFRRREE